MNCFCGIRSFMKNFLYREIRNQEMDLIQKLKAVEHKKLPLFSFQGKTTVARVVDVYDGDTLTIVFEYNGEIMKYKMRAMGYDCAEMKPKKDDPNRDKEKELAKLAKSRFIELMGGDDAIVRIKMLGFDKYGRILGYIYHYDDDVEVSKSINDKMIEEGHGKVYLGGTKEEW
jgi:endonuclease YncB( thermonuclease family)